MLVTGGDPVNAYPSEGAVTACSYVTSCCMPVANVTAELSHAVDPHGLMLIFMPSDWACSSTSVNDDSPAGEGV